MAHTLKYRATRIRRQICLSDPGHDTVYIRGLGLIEGEWTWCRENMQLLKISAEVGEKELFIQTGIKLINYLKWKRKK